MNCQRHLHSLTGHPNPNADHVCTRHREMYPGCITEKGQKFREKTSVTRESKHARWQHRKVAHNAPGLTLILGKVSPMGGNLSILFLVQRSQTEEIERPRISN